MTLKRRTKFIAAIVALLTFMTMVIISFSVHDDDNAGQADYAESALHEWAGGHAAGAPANRSYDYGRGFESRQRGESPTRDQTDPSMTQKENP